MRTVLIFDVSAVTCHTVSKQLRMYGFETIQARSLGTARAALAANRVDLVILDLAADAGGLALVRELRRDHTFHNVPVIILTSSPHDSDRIDARAAGAAAFLTKPVSTRELTHTVNSALALRAPAGGIERTGGNVAPKLPQRRHWRPEWAVSPTGPALQ